MKKDIVIQTIYPLILITLPGAFASADELNEQVVALPSPESAEVQETPPSAIAENNSGQDQKKAADPDQIKRENQLKSRISVLEARISEATTRTVHGNFGGKTASASPPILGENWFFTGEMLWWHVDEGGTDYAQLFHGFPGISSKDSVQNRRLKFKWDWGFRAGIGKTFDHDKWDLHLDFTWFRAENSSASSLHSGLFLTPLMLVPLQEASKVKIHWNLHFYTLDLNLGRNYFVSPKLALHPYAGLKGAWISQHIRTNNDIIAPLQRIIKSKQRNDFWGIGPQLGMEGKWFLDYGFNLFASGGGSLLWGDFDIRHKENSPAIDTARTKFDLDIHEVVPMAQFQIGIGYETNLYHNTYRIEISARYENQYWWSLNQMPYFSLFGPGRFQRYSEDLSLQGLTVDVRFDF